MEMKVDVGQNLTSMLERLAAQIGTTADKVFPWYVQQAQIEGAITVSLAGIALMLSLVALAYGVIKGKWDSGGDPDNLAAVATILGGILLVTSSLFSLLNVPGGVTKIYNPQFHAMQMMSRDIGRMVGK